MKRIILIRHGQSAGNVRLAGGKTEETYINDSEIELSDEGKVQVESLARRLNDYLLDKENIELWNSPFVRTRQTAEILNNVLGIDKVYEDPRLVEQDYGDFDFQFFEDWKTISPHSFFINQRRYHNVHSRFWARVENGESMADVYNRISLFDISRCKDNLNDQVIVTHGAFIKVALMYFTLEKVEYVSNDEFKITNATAYVLEKEDGDSVYKLTKIIQPN